MKANPVDIDFESRGWPRSRRRGRGGGVNSILMLASKIAEFGFFPIVFLQLSIAMGLLNRAGARLGLLLVDRAVDQLQMAIGLGNPRWASRVRVIGRLGGSRLPVQNESLVAVPVARGSSIARRRVRCGSMMRRSGRMMGVYIDTVSDESIWLRMPYRSWDCAVGPYGD